MNIFTLRNKNEDLYANVEMARLGKVKKKKN